MFTVANIIYSEQVAIPFCKQLTLNNHCWSSIHSAVVKHTPNNTCVCPSKCSTDIRYTNDSKNINCSNRPSIWIKHFECCDVTDVPGETGYLQQFPFINSDIGKERLPQDYYTDSEKRKFSD